MPTSIILTSNVKNLGSEGDQVSVADGYARNFLIPQKMAIPATAVAIRKIESLKLLRAERERKELEQAQELAGRISKLNSTVELQSGENGKVFGSVTSLDIANALNSRGFEIDKKAVLLDEPIKKIGTFEISIRLHAQVNATFKLTTTSPTMPVTTEEASGEGRPKTGKGRPVKKKA